MVRLFVSSVSPDAAFVSVCVFAVDAFVAFMIVSEYGWLCVPTWTEGMKKFARSIMAMDAVIKNAIMPICPFLFFIKSSVDCVFCFYEKVCGRPVSLPLEIDGVFSFIYAIPNRLAVPYTIPTIATVDSVPHSATSDADHVEVFVPLTVVMNTDVNTTIATDSPIIPCINPIFSCTSYSLLYFYLI